MDSASTANLGLIAPEFARLINVVTRPREFRRQFLVKGQNPTSSNRPLPSFWPIPYCKPSFGNGEPKKRLMAKLLIARICSGISSIHVSKQALKLPNFFGRDVVVHLENREMAPTPLLSSSVGLQSCPHPSIRHPNVNHLEVLSLPDDLPIQQRINTTGIIGHILPVLRGHEFGDSLNEFADG